MSEEIATQEIKFVIIAPDQRGLEHIASLFSQQIDESEQTISKAEQLIAYLDDTEKIVSQLPDKLWQSAELLIQGLELVISQEQERIISMQKGIDAASPFAQPAEPKAHAYKVGDLVQIRRKRSDNGQPVKPNWTHDLWARVEKVGRTTLTVRFRNIEQTQVFNLACFNLAKELTQ